MIDAAGEFEPGARRWCYYANNLLGDPAMVVWISNDQTSLEPKLTEGPFALNKPLSWTISRNTCQVSLALHQRAPVTAQVLDPRGRTIATLFDGVARAGTMIMNWNTVSVAPGAYIIHVASANETSAACITIGR
ncbi:MAG: hypothetical protein JW795_13525 [Chitinivibrionales bacterium]|nr:hypothetical protein [Chitinivibrionales bacterium]